MDIDKSSAIDQLKKQNKELLYRIDKFQGFYIDVYMIIRSYIFNKVELHEFEEELKEVMKPFDDFREWWINRNKTDPIDWQGFSE